jgi:flavodoxin
LSNVEIYWFSGTGNSLAIARALAEKTSAQLTPIATLIKAKTIISPAETVGLVFPVYDFKAPAIIKEFITKFEEFGNK